jgi:hypothetical protein
MYSTNYDSSEEEDDPEYCDSSSDESDESANHQSTSEEEDAFFLFLWKLKSLRIHDFFQVEKFNNPFSYLWRVFRPWVCLPLACFQIIGLSSNSHRCSHTHKK